MPKIVIILPDLRGGGVERMRLILAAAWKDMGYAVELVLFEKRGDLLPLVPPGVTVHCLSASRLRQAVRPLRAYLARVQPSVLVAAMWPVTVIALLAARSTRFRGKVIVSDHNALSLTSQAGSAVKSRIVGQTIRFLYPLADKRVTVSRGVAEDIETLSGLSADQFDVIYNPANVDVRADDLLSISQEQFCERRMLLAVGTLKPQKDHVTLVRAFARLADYAEYNLVILGEGDMRSTIEECAEKEGVADRVSLPGFVVDTSRYFRQARLFVFSSRFEGFGNVLVEALSFGVPIVSTDCVAGPREILADGRYGRLVPIADPDAFACAMSKALAEKPDRDELLRRAGHFSTENIAREYLRGVLTPP